MAFDLATFNPQASIGDRARGKIKFHYDAAEDAIAVFAADDFFLSQQTVLPVGTQIRITSLSGNYDATVVLSDPTNLDIVLFPGGVEFTSGVATVDIVNSLKIMTTTAANIITVPNGTTGQIMTLVHQVDGGSAVVTPTNLAGGSTITLALAGSYVTLLFGLASWAVSESVGAIVA